MLFLHRSQLSVRKSERVHGRVIYFHFFQQKKDGSLSHRTVLEEITSTYDDLGMRCERDAFDTLFDHAPDKLQVVKKVWLFVADISFNISLGNGLTDGFLTDSLFFTIFPLLTHPLLMTTVAILASVISLWHLS
jgi:hypothetical protein